MRRSSPYPVSPMAEREGAVGSTGLAEVCDLVEVVEDDLVLADPADPAELVDLVSFLPSRLAHSCP